MGARPERFESIAFPVFGTYTIRLNHRHKWIGHVLSGRHRAQMVEGSGNGYLRTASDYVHLNPVQAHFNF